MDKDKVKWEEKLEEQQRRHLIELKNVKEKLKIEQDEWKDDILKKQQDQNSDYMKKVRDDLVRERNREIEAIINKLGDETHDT